MEKVRNWLTKFIRSWWPLITVLVVSLIFRSFFLVYRINGQSMNPTLQDGEYGVATRTIISHLDRGDIVIVDNEDKLLIKRLIGEPGDHVKCENNVLTINDEVVEESYTQGETSDFDIVLGDDEYFVMGDNREHSSDSRLYGAFNKSDILGVIIKET